MSRGTGSGRVVRLTAAVFALAVAIALLGPRVRVEERWTEPTIGDDVDAYLADSEARVPHLRAEAAKSVVWLDPSERARTPLALVYLHGFSADRHEVEPLVSELARDVGANVYFARLSGHGRDNDAMGDASVEDWLDDAAEALAVGRRIGERVVLIGTSTGGTLALWAASRPEAAEGLAALVLISPNLGPKDRRARMLLWPWGGLIAHVVEGRDYCFDPLNEEQERHWATCYPTRALLPMMALVDLARSLDPSSVTVPALVVYSRGDQVVDPSATERLLRIEGWAPQRFVVEGAEDPEQHVIAGAIMSPGTTQRVRARVLDFLARRAGVEVVRGGTASPPHQ